MYKEAFSNHKLSRPNASALMNLTQNTVAKQDSALKKEREQIALPPIDAHRPRIQSSQTVIGGKQLNSDKKFMA
jgi:hypothetical protein